MMHSKSAKIIEDFQKNYIFGFFFFLPPFATDNWTVIHIILLLIAHSSRNNRPRKMSLTESKHKQSTIGADDPFYPREGKTLTWSGVGMNVVSDCKTAVRMINYWLTRTTTPIDILGAKPHCCYYVKRYTTKSCYEVMLRSQP